MPIAKINGAEMYYEEAGSGSPLILSPGGLQGVLSSYQPVSAKLSQAHRVITYDRRFGGQSTSPLVVQTWDLVCQDVIRLMDVLGIEQAHLGGGSFGAAIANVIHCAIAVPLPIENTPGALTDDRGEGVLGAELWMWKRNRGMFVHGVSTPASYRG